jgi:N-terminal acetyltransferase B complex non-catalytic subunit
LLIVWLSILYVDFEQAMTNYNKEGSSSKKQCHFSLILVTQLAAEQRLQRAGPDDSMAKLQCDIACKLMKQAYMASSV